MHRHRAKLDMPYFHTLNSNDARVMSATVVCIRQKYRTSLWSANAISYHSLPIIFFSYARLVVCSNQIGFKELGDLENLIQRLDGWLQKVGISSCGLIQCSVVAYHP